jgi:SAM-dependent methyltransferase
MFIWSASNGDGCMTGRRKIHRARKDRPDKTASKISSVAGASMLSQEARLISALPFLAEETLTDVSEILFRDQLEWLNKLPSDFGSILDVGAGAGYHSKYFELMGHVVTACDKNDRFVFKDTIEFFESTLEELPPKRKYDAIFVSHVMEHIPNLGSFFDQLKTLLNDRGYLFVVVPNTGLTENGHWLEGWSITQLGVMLCSLGFDCTDSFFATFGYHTIGFGKKTDRANCDFLIDECLPFLPAKFAELRFVGLYAALQRNVSFVDSKTIVRTISPQDLVDPARLKDAEARLTDAEARVNHAEARRNEAEARVNHADARVNDAEARRNDADARVNHAEARLNHAEARLNHAEAALKDTEARLNDTEARLNDSEARRNDTEARLKDAEARLNDTEARLNDTEARLTDAEGRRNDAEARRNDAEAEILKVREELARVFGSRSWKVTRPLRQLVGAMLRKG